MSPPGGAEPAGRGRDRSDGPAPDPFEGPDPGLASERTDLAWNRSGLALLACGAAVAKGMTVGDPLPARTAIGALILVLGFVVWALGGWEAHHRRAPGLARRTATPGDLLPVALGTAGVGVAAFALGLFFPA